MAFVLPDPITIWAALGGAVTGALGTLGAAYLNRGPALQQAANMAAKGMLEEYRIIVESLRREVRELKDEVHLLRTHLAMNGIAAPASRIAAAAREIKAPE